MPNSRWPATTGVCVSGLRSASLPSGLGSRMPPVRKPVQARAFGF